MKKYTPVILGTDFWTDCDDAVAIRLIAEMEKMGYVKFGTKQNLEDAVITGLKKL